MLFVFLAAAATTHWFAQIAIHITQCTHTHKCVVSWIFVVVVVISEPLFIENVFSDDVICDAIRKMCVICWDRMDRDVTNELLLQKMKEIFEKTKSNLWFAFVGPRWNRICAQWIVIFYFIFWNANVVRAEHKWFGKKIMQKSLTKERGAHRDGARRERESFETGVQNIRRNRYQLYFRIDFIKQPTNDLYPFFDFIFEIKGNRSECVIRLQLKKNGFSFLFFFSGLPLSCSFIVFSVYFHLHSFPLNFLSPWLACLTSRFSIHVFFFFFFQFHFRLMICVNVYARVHFSTKCKNVYNGIKLGRSNGEKKKKQKMCAFCLSLKNWSAANRHRRHRKKTLQIVSDYQFPIPVAVGQFGLGSFAI